MLPPVPDDPVVRVCFVCLGNICRSPTAEAVMATAVAAADLETVIAVDSAGTGGWHVGDPPDDRATAAAARRGVAMGHLRGRQLRATDLDDFDVVAVMDHDNLRDVRRLGSGRRVDHVRLLRSFDPDAAERDPHGFDHAVPDPYYGGPDGFDLVLDLVTAACDGLLDHLVLSHGLTPSR